MTRINESEKEKHVRSHGTAGFNILVTSMAVVTIIAQIVALQARYGIFDKEARAETYQVSDPATPKGEYDPIIRYPAPKTDEIEDYGLIAKAATPTIEDAEKPAAKIEYKYDTVIEKLVGVHQGPSGKETWYDLNMDGVVELMRGFGYGEDEYPYWIREDGAKMFGEYVMVAADLSVRPKGTILECSLGTAMVVDTGDLEPYQLDIAVDWED